MSNEPDIDERDPWVCRICGSSCELRTEEAGSGTGIGSVVTDDDGTPGFEVEDVQNAVWDTVGYRCRACNEMSDDLGKLVQRRSDFDLAGIAATDKDDARLLAVRAKFVEEMAAGACDAFNNAKGWYGRLREDEKERWRDAVRTILPGSLPT